RTRRCSRRRGHVGFPRFIAHSAPAAAELGRSAPEGALMSFSENLAKVVADQLARFVTLNRHQLAGHVANLDFWVAQARHALEVIDGYQERFRRLKAGQAEYVATHQTTVSSPVDPDIKGPPE